MQEMRDTWEECGEEQVEEPEQAFSHLLYGCTYPLCYSGSPKREKKKNTSPARQVSFAGGKSLIKNCSGQKLDFSIEEGDLIEVCGEQPGLFLDTITEFEL